METKSPARSGRLGPSARCACAIFSTIVWAINNSRFGNTLLACHPEQARTELARRARVEGPCASPVPVRLIRTALAQNDIQQKASAVTRDTSGTAPLCSTSAFCCWPHIRFQQPHQLAYRAQLLQPPNRILHFLLRLLREYALGQSGELFFDLTVGERIA